MSLWLYFSNRVEVTKMRFAVTSGNKFIRAANLPAITSETYTAAFSKKSFKTLKGGNFSTVDTTKTTYFRVKDAFSFPFKFRMPFTDKQALEEGLVAAYKLQNTGKNSVIVTSYIH